MEFRYIGWIDLSQCNIMHWKEMAMCLQGFSVSCGQCWQSWQSTPTQQFALALFVWRRLRALWSKRRQQMLAESVEGLVVVVTGAASGIGAATVSLFAAKGWRVYAVDVDEKNLQRLYGSSSQVQSLVTDLTDTAACDCLAERIRKDCSSGGEKSGSIAVLVNCAGFILPLPVLGASWRDIERQFRVNTLAPVYLTRLLTPLLLRASSSSGRGGSVVNVSSMAAAIGWPYQGLYSASKAALEGFSSSLRRELVSSSLPLRVSCVQPGPVRSPFAAGVVNTLLQWAQDNPGSPFAPGAHASASLKLRLEQQFISLTSPLITVSCEEVAEVIYHNAVSVETPPPTCVVMTPVFRLLRLLMLTLPSPVADYVAGKYL